MAEREDPEIAELWEKFKGHGGSRRDWDNLILKPEWPDGVVSWISTEDPDRSSNLDAVFSQHVNRCDMVEFVVRNQKGAITGEALGRVEGSRTVKGHYAMKLIHLAFTGSHYMTNGRRSI